MSGFPAKATCAPSAVEMASKPASRRNPGLATLCNRHKSPRCSPWVTFFEFPVFVFSTIIVPVIVVIFSFVELPWTRSPRSATQQWDEGTTADRWLEKAYPLALMMTVPDGYCSEGRQSAPLLEAILPVLEFGFLDEGFVGNTAVQIPVRP